MSAIMAIDDDPDFLQLLQDFLEGEEHTVMTCASVRASIDRLREQGPADLIISDIFMPEADGLELLRAIHRFSPPIPVILISGRVLPRFNPLQAGRKLGAAAVLTKPLELTELLNTVDRLLARHDGMMAATQHGERLFS